MMSTTKKEIMINGRFLTGPLTGVQRVALEIVKALDELLTSGLIDSTQYSFTLLYNGEITQPIILKHIQIIKQGMLTGNLWEQLELPLYSYGKLLINLCSIAPLFKCRQIVFVHDVSFLVNKHFFSKSFRLWYSAAIPIIGKLCRGMVTVSDFSKNELIKYAGVSTDKITVIYNAAEHILNAGAPDGEFLSKIHSLKPYCLAVSSLGANKNFNGLNAALKKIDFGNYQMLIAGGGLKVLQHSVAETGAATYLGYVSDDELHYLYSNAALFVFPSFYEGFGIPPLEAMILGCPVIASQTSAMPEVLGTAAAYFNPFDTDDMGVKINKLLHEPDELEQLKSKGYKRAALYNWHQSATQLFHLIKTCNE